MAFLHKNMDGAKDNLITLKGLRELLPSYLIMQERVMPDGKVDRGKNNTNEMVNPFNNNSIKIFASATNKMRAASLLRGKTLTSIWYDEYGFLPYNDVIYMNAAPAFKTASMNARRNGSPYGITITTTPGFLTTPEGKEAYDMKEMASKFSESWYDLTYPQLLQILNANTKSDFVYIRYTYEQLGASEEWFKDICKLLKNSWPDIRREILLEWSTGVENSPFKEDDLNTLRGMIRAPISVVYLLGKYRFETYQQADTRTYPPIIGVDVAAGYKQDSSTITIIDSRTTNVLGCMNCNYISVVDLSRCIEFIVKNWMPNSCVIVERNGVGHGVVAYLIKAGLKKNLYYEIKDVVQEDRMDGVHAYRQKIRTKVYGLNSTKDVRKTLIDLVIDRVERHKDKVLSPIIYNELLGMEVKPRTGKVEHSDSTHDDQVFSWALALYVWYEGTNLTERYGIKKTTIRTDEDIDEQIEFDNETTDIIESFTSPVDDLDEQIENDLKNAIKAKGTLITEFLEQRRLEEREKFHELVRTPMGERAFRQFYSIPKDQPIERYISGFNTTNQFRVPDKVFDSFYDAPSDNFFNNLSDRPTPSAVPASQAMLLEDGEYKYSAHFNF